MSDGTIAHPRRARLPGRRDTSPGEKLETFAMERMQSTCENLVDFNLSESGVHPLTPEELARRRGAARRGARPSPASIHSPTEPSPLASGSRRCHPAQRNNIQVPTAARKPTTSGLEPGRARRRVVMIVPNYMQTGGLARAFGGRSRNGRLASKTRRAARWRARSRRARAAGVAAHAS